MNRKLTIEKLIINDIEPYFLSVKDVSEEHRGHQSFKEDVESHFEIVVVAKKFHNRNKIERHRIVNKALKEEFLSDLHSITLKAFSIQEYKEL